jgi:hypothetical protein
MFTLLTLNVRFIIIKENPHKASDGFIEDQYDARFITLQNMIEEVGQKEVLEIWKVVDIRSERRTHVHFVIIVNEISFLCSCLKSISKGIICRHYFRVIMNSKTAAFHISMIPQRWYKDIYQDGLNSQEGLIFEYGSVRNTDEAILPIRKPVTIPTSIPILKKAIHKRNLYGHVWGLARTATLLAVEQEDDEITTFLRDYISRKSNREDERSAIGKRPTIERPTVNESSIVSVKRLKRPIIERPTVNESFIVGVEISNNSHEIQINEGNTGNTSNGAALEKDKEIVTNLQNVKNPNKVTTKGRPPKRRYLSSIEKKQCSQKISKTRGSYQCHVCNGIGHNAAFHKSANKS